MSAAPIELALATRRDTRLLAVGLAPHLQAGDLLILNGLLGAGKTFFVRALARALRLPSRVRVTSPTFTLVHELATQPPMRHADLYRLSQRREVDELGLLEGRDEGWLIVAEWAEPWLDALGGDAVVLTLSGSPRRAQLVATGSRSEAILAGFSRRRDRRFRAGTRGVVEGARE